MGDHRSSDHFSERIGTLIAALEARDVVDPTRILSSAEQMMVRDGFGNASRVVARAWADDGFRQRLLADGNAVREVIGSDMTDGFLPDLVLKVVENTASYHNVVVCTLCSCYPIAVFGPPPSWYKSEAYRSRVVLEPRAVLAEFGLTLPDGVEVRVWDSTSEIRYMVLPCRPEGTEGFSEEALAALVTQESIIGTGQPRTPAAG